MRPRFLNSLVIAIAGILLSACGSGGSSGNPVVDTDPVVLDEPVQTVSPVFSGSLETEGAQSFRLNEDAVLRGLFYKSSDSPDTSASIKSLPQHGLLTLEPGGEVFVYTPEADFWGEDGFVYETSGGVRLTVSFEVMAVNDVPVISAELPRVAAQGQRFTHQLIAYDSDGDELSFFATGLPSWLSLDSATGVLSGLPTQADIGFSNGITLTVTDSSGLSAELQKVTFEVIDVNDAPTLNLTQLPAELKAREVISVRLYPDDADGEPVTLDVEENDFITGEAKGGTVTLTASDVNEVMDVNIVIRATDDRGRISREIVPFTIYPLTASGRGLTLAGIKDGRAVHVVILGDGYTIDQQNLFREHADTLIENLREDAGIVAHFDALSFHTIYTESKSTNADDSDLVDARDTYYDSAYGCGSIQRLICANNLTLLQTAIEEYPDFDQVILLVNDVRFGGSGNSGSSTAITSAYFPEIALHEMGHSQANLADEYIDNLIVETAGLPAFVEGNFANVTAISDPELVPWAHWIDPAEPLPQMDGDQGVGIFEGGLYRDKGIYRATYDSRMRNYNAEFGPVNSERWILSLYEDTDGGIHGFLPVTRSVKLASGESQTFVVSPIFEQNVQKVEWVLDGEILEPGLDPNSLTLTPATGRHVLSLTVSDISGAIRKPAPHPGVFSWTWVVEVQ
ncbi:M64 family metallopeptidase [Granulosicoccus antarcticus]|uniref:Dystroglycan-type cadherin-like domain-containing protein n=1 Tax=Granulosicoccus antarcticus IMCC3135 TaxID=1192854 RepID=A0A2Z2NME1_9GAMM|nr:M64 family metallopeptidase [Granulosicoccus antarcticus]ASJ72363.1 hypothetical protein IMCC3135_11365 [Granulosicoccus antarcticus IMCC3135]